MRKLLLVPLAGLVLAACDRRTSPDVPASADALSAAPATSALQMAAESLPITDHVWLRAGQLNAPGAILIFLADGTLVTDSCWETYRLSHWQAEGDRRLLWQEDGIDIRAEVVKVDQDELTLQMEFASGAEQHRFVAATVPYVCPDMPR